MLALQVPNAQVAPPPLAAMQVAPGPVDGISALGARPQSTSTRSRSFEKLTLPPEVQKL
jgi:hypothetical protein